ncbi:hypothetical protein [Pseudomonas carnis]|uniref:hypothetical protein n=1 Tax=Pseudomonas carnis TaxID=2487355 RepID=UPI001BC9CA05|nr:hypothetical protein [Pseudomonas carnis]
MPSFALIAEGITDQAILERIIFTVSVNILNDIDDEADVQSLQPLRDATDQSRVAGGVFGGWERVREFCQSPERLEQALEFNDYLVIHIDTDMCEHPNFGVHLLEGGIPLSATILLGRVSAKIYEWLGENFINSHSERVILAIAVHSTECWLLTYYGRSEADKCKEINCYTHLERNLARLDRRIEKTHRSFSEVSTCFRKNKELNTSRAVSISLEAFVSSLEQKLSERIAVAE